jgi:Tol biopolymer transport system component
MQKLGCGLGCVLIVAMLALVACGGSSDGASSPSSAVPSGASSLSRTASPGGIPLPAPAVTGTIAFTSDRGWDEETLMDDTDVCVVNTDGTGLTALTGGKGSAAHPRWSPDGKRIAYDVGLPGLKGLSQVWVMNADGSGKTQLTRGSLGFRNMFPSWSPDGKRIVFTSLVFYTDGVERDAIYVMNADGSGLHNVTSTKGPGVTSADYWPTWEKDGTITFYRNTRDGGLSKFSVNPDGSGLTRLVEEAGTSRYNDQDKWVKYELALSPDGKTIARHDTGADRLVVVPADGGGDPVTLLDPVAAFAEISADVAWSPDGRSLAIAGQNETGFTRLYIVNTDGTGLSAVPGVDAASDPAWRPE